MQATIKSAVTFEGVGLHSGAIVRMVVRPAAADHGIWFRRSDMALGNNLIPAIWDAVVSSQLCTLLHNEAGAKVSTVEHIMAALAGCGIHNAMIDVDGPEVPILDGSSAQFVKGLMGAGIAPQNAPLKAVKVLKPVEVRDGLAVARLDPANELRIDFSIDFADDAIGTQTKSLNMANGAFVRELSACRTFCRKADVDTMQANGLALGGTFDNAVVVDGADVLSPGGFRIRDEAVRHKMLDALGDLALAGRPLLARYTGERAGHAMTNKLLRALFADPSNYRIVTCDSQTAARLPGVGVKSADMPAYAFA
ncbi:MAG: UDP-3-O-[3-hydroxymyristoyl] N-acetylglucosamine deacetylase [Halocynthiibacter sp.]